MKRLFIVGVVIAAVFTAAGCKSEEKKKEKETEKGKEKEKDTGTETEKATDKGTASQPVDKETPEPGTPPPGPAAVANPAIAELAPLWPEIAKCDELSDYYAQEKCPANFKLLETAKAAYEGREKDPVRFGQVHEAIVDQVINGTDLKARQCAAYADWSKANRGAEKYADDAKQALALVDALKKLGKSDGEDAVGYGIGNMLSGWWGKDGDVRNQMMAVISDKGVQSTGGRRELIRHASWTATENAAIVDILKTIATDGTDDPSVRREAIDGMSYVMGDRPELVDTVLALTGDADTDVQGAAVRALGNAKPGTEAATKAQAKLLEIGLAPEASASAVFVPGALGRVGDLAALAAFGKYHKANAAKPGVTSAMRDLIYAYVFGGRFKGDAAADAALRKAIDAVLAAKTATPWDVRYMMDALGGLGGKKSVAKCKKYVKDKDASVAESATKCVETAGAAK